MKKPTPTDTTSPEIVQKIKYSLLLNTTPSPLAAKDDVVQTIGYKLYPSDFSPVDTTTTTDASKFTYRDRRH